MASQRASVLTCARKPTRLCLSARALVKDERLARPAQASPIQPNRTQPNPKRSPIGVWAGSLACEEQQRLVHPLRNMHICTLAYTRSPHICACVRVRMWSVAQPSPANQPKPPRSTQHNPVRASQRHAAQSVPALHRARQQACARRRDPQAQLVPPSAPRKCTVGWPC